MGEVDALRQHDSDFGKGTAPITGTMSGYRNCDTRTPPMNVAPGSWSHGAWQIHFQLAYVGEHRAGCPHLPARRGSLHLLPVHPGLSSGRRPGFNAAAVTGASNSCRVDAGRSLCLGREFLANLRAL